MYDLAEVREAMNSWWRGLARALTKEGLKDVPVELHRDGDHRESWTRPDLFLGQTCGYPLTHELRDKVTVVATPHFGAEGCEGPKYASWIVVHKGARGASLADFRGLRAAVSNPASHSGYNAFRHAVAPLADHRPFFSNVTVSGGHLRSIQLIAEGKADIAAVDCVTFALLERHNPTLVNAVRRLGMTAMAPGLPYITSRQTDDDTQQRLRAGLHAACSDPTLAECRDALLIRAFSILSLADYEEIDVMERDAIARGYPTVM